MHRADRWTRLVLVLSLASAVFPVAARTSGAGFMAATQDAGNSFRAASSFGPVIALVQEATAASSGMQGSVTVSLSSTPVAGNLLVAVYDRTGGPAGLPAGWTVAVERDGLLVAYRVAGSSEPQDFTFGGGPPTQRTVTVLEYSGLSASSPLDRTASADSGGAAVTSVSTGTTAATSQADELLVAGVSTDGSPGGFAGSWTNGFTGRTTVESTGLGQVSAHTTAHRVVASTGQYETSESWATALPATGVIATFRAAP